MHNTNPMQSTPQKRALPESTGVAAPEGGDSRPAGQGAAEAWPERPGGEAVCAGDNYSSHHIRSDPFVIGLAAHQDL